MPRFDALSLPPSLSRRERGSCFADAIRKICACLDLIPPLEIFSQTIDLFEREPERLADIAHGAARAISDERRRERRAVAAVFRINVLDDFLAPLVFEIDVDIGRLVAFFR